ncbi:hypothetical protein FisN_10Hu401 [Fistulifera solaris]|uniref:Uncharacterized protein n=1 Tax=Fistulifera solaris TaxID=1519565 RepID=A0A1Z5JRJ3_FISSO|nr:hypothetical protein FisN_10Hu401 [Fistulifera solaris]|eukprot:GAX16381.1 hypothetical protein FisN_10Hu401 [Fistulifera solaris]
MSWYNNISTLLKRIPEEILSPQQKFFRPIKSSFPLPVYQFVREPISLDEVVWKSYYNTALCPFTIWRDNETIICIAGVFLNNQERKVWLTLEWDNKFVCQCTIFGKTDAAIADTIAFLCSLPYSGESKLIFESFLNDDTNQPPHHFRLTALQPEHLARILDANPKRQFEIASGVWSPEQSVVLATRSFPVNLHFTNSHNVSGAPTLADGGTAFVEALEKRRSSFGFLYLTWGILSVAFSHDNLKRLFQVGVFEKLRIETGREKELVLLPFSAQANELFYTCIAEDIELEDFNSVKILARAIRLNFYFRHWKGWNKVLAAFFDRVAESGHIEILSFAVVCLNDSIEDNVDEDMPLVVDALINAIIANPSLNYLNLNGCCDAVNWTPHLQRIFRALEEHPGIRTIYLNPWSVDDDNDDGASNYNYGDSDVESDDYSDGEFYRVRHVDLSWVEHLISRNRYITVLNPSGNRITNGTTLDKLYEVNHIYQGSEQLTKVSNTELRVFYVATALTERVSHNFQYIGLTLSMNTDTLCELVDNITSSDLK